MAFDFGELVSPAHTAVVTCEMQRGIIGDLTSRPGAGGRGGRARHHRQERRAVPGGPGQRGAASCTPWSSCAATAPVSRSTTR